MMTNNQNITNVILPEADVLLDVADLYLINDETEIIFCIDSCLFFECDPQSKNIINYCMNNESLSLSSIKEEFNGIINELELNDILSELFWAKILMLKGQKRARWHDDKTPETFSPTNISLNITHKCNLHCIYCYGDGGSYGTPNTDMTKDIAKASVDWLCANIDRVGSKRGEIVFFGGEPLLNRDLIEFVATYVTEKMKNKDYKIGLCMTTNGTLLTEDNSRLIEKHGINAMISVDGPPSVQNKQRPYVNGNPSFEDVVNGFATFKKITGKRLSARATFTDFNIVQSVDALSRIGFKSVYVAPASGECGKWMRTQKGLQNMISEYSNLFEYFYRRVTSNPEKPISYLNSIFIKTISSLYERKIQPWPCGGGRSYAGVAPNGDIFLCHRFVGNAKFKMGNVIDENNETPLYKQIIEMSGKRNGKCKTCWIRSLCAGGCYYVNLDTSGDIFESEEYECELNRKVVELSILYFRKLKKNFPEILDRICGKTLPEHKIVDQQSPTMLNN